MKKTMKKVLSVLLSVFLMSSVFALFASAETWEYNDIEFEIQTEGDYRFIILSEAALTDEDKACGITASSAYITQYTNTAPSITIPATLGGKPVSCIGYQAFKDNNAIQTVTIGASVKSINSESFLNCKGLQTVLIASGVERILTSAFNGCSALKSVTFQKGSALKSIGDSVFSGCTSLNNFTIPEGTESIGTGAFVNCDSMTSITIPNSVTSIGGAAFMGCDSLQTAVIGDGITVLPTRNENWGDDWGSDEDRDGTFEGCISLQSVTFGSGLLEIGQDCFAGCGLLEVNIPDNIQIIGNAAFLNCRSNKKVTTGDGVTSIGWRAFENNTALQEITIGKNVLSIGDIAFRNCDSLASVTIPTNVTSIGNALFFSCDSLETVVIGNGVTALPTRDENWGDNWGTDEDRDGAFEGCVKLKSVSIGSAVTSIGQDCFAGTALETVDIPDNVITLSHGVFMNCKSLAKIEIGNGCTSIGYRSFENDSALTDVTIGKGVISIGDIAFRNCDGLKYIYIPSNVTTLGTAMFFDCNSLEKVVIGNGVTSLNTRHENWGDDWGTDEDCDGTFEGCVNLSSVTLGSGIISIGQDSFAGTKIKTVTVPGKVSTLSDGAFAGASELKDIYFTGNWASSVGGNLFNGLPEGYKLYYINGKVGYDELPYNRGAFTPITVTFDINNDDVFAAPTEDQVMSPLGGYVIEPISPTALGYLFDGWYKDSACTQKWNFATDRVSADTTLYAKWNAVDAVAPVRPENIDAPEKDGNSVTLQWSAVDGAISYNVYVNGKKANSSPIGTTNYTVTGLESATTYEFAVTAVNGVGESEKSLIFAERTTDHIHTFDEWIVKLQPTCVTDGQQTRTCSSCGATETEAIPATGVHTFGDWVVTTEASCFDMGAQERICSVCGETETEKIPAIGEHSFGEWVITKEPTVNEEGEQKKTCTVCGASEIQAIPRLPEHSYILGDVNGDGSITAADARIALRASANLTVLDERQILAADADGNGKITAVDARKILRVSAHLDVFA